MRALLASVLFATVPSCAPPADGSVVEHDGVSSIPQATLYGSDDRRDLYEVPADDARAVGRAAVAMIAPEQLRARAEGGYTIDAPSLRDAYGTCDDERFADQPAAANCSGVLIAPDLVATSAHCVPGDARTASCGVSRYVFGYALPSVAAVDEPIVIDAADVYDCVEVLARMDQDPDADCRWDLAIVRLDRRVSAARLPVTLRTAPAREGEPLRVMGFPLGLPAKLDTGAQVLDAREGRPDYFSLDSDTFHVSSGSAVLDARGELVGLIARGGRDWEDAGACVRAHRASAQIAEQEEATKASVLAAVLEEQVVGCEAIGAVRADAGVGQLGTVASTARERVGASCSVTVSGPTGASGGDRSPLALAAMLAAAGCVALRVRSRRLAIARRVAMLALTPLGVGCGQAGDDAAAIEIPPFARCDRNASDGRPIEVVPSGFERGGEPFVPHGIGSYPLLEHVGRNRLAEVRDIFAQANAMGRPIVRTNAFMDGGSNPGRIRDDDGSVREQGLSALDTLLAAARDADVQLLLLLTNNWSDYGGAEAVVRAVAPGEALPKDAFWSDPRAIESQAGYIRALVTRRNTVNGQSYGSDATIFAWELANEARCTDAQYCEPDTLAAWARRMADEARAAGAQQPVAWGGSGHVDSYGERLAQIGEEGGVDILTVHIYPAASHPDLSSESAPMRIHDAIELGARRIVAASDVALALDMPLLIEELGWAPPEGANRDEERAQVYRAWLALAHQRGHVRS